MDEKKKISPHILNASASLLGFSFILLTTLRALHLADDNYIYEFSSLAVGIFVLSCIFAFLSIRNGETPKGNVYENIADYIFLSGLGLLFLMAALIEFRFL